MLGAFFSYKETKDEGGEKKNTKIKTKEEKQLQKRNNVDKKRWMSSLMRSHDFLKTNLPPPSVFGEKHVGVYLPG